VIGLGGKLAIETEESLLIGRERLWFQLVSDHLKLDGRVRSSVMRTYADVDLVLLMGVHREGVFRTCGNDRRVSFDYFRLSSDVARMFGG
jgi:hypothetical protein